MRKQIIKLFYKYHSFIRFGIVGCINTFNYYLIYLLLMSLDIGYLISHTAGFSISLIGSFYLNCYYTYKVKPTWKKFFQFPMTYVINYLVSSISIFVIVDILSMNKFIAPIISLLLPIPFTYVVSRWILSK
ncbi:GtrA family protein [Virgibacillus sp. JSM 102003]|uniref:GtrA family protein n=1 Tax=Virgibacillus sp. JSM 102003 TaxID=1562108 RepID=UPI0035BFAECD